MTLMPEQKSILINGTELTRDSVEYLNRTLVVGSDIMADTAFKAAKTENGLLTTEHDVTGFEVDDSVIDDLREIVKRSQRVNDWIDSQIVKKNPQVVVY